MKMYLLKEHNNEFVIKVKNLAAAKFACEMYNAVIIKEIKK